ncbi:hypothetical protein DdX_18153 [Ditylenchus destructor]|uniref:F-box domain-containing protein n=1 Tax=Ditylenchus destructor TaxID=166010 RepID=A0AAD4MKT2_9BILA|nr:hypothetical protein DdX_18153 [Ditylenchus destructor]
MDNGTMVEAFRFLNYCQLAKSSLVSKRFWNLIRNNRHSLALLYVRSIGMDSYHGINDHAVIEMFDKELSPEAFNEWVIRNNYSKQIPLEVVKIQCIQYESIVYEIRADAMYKDPKYGRDDDITDTFSAKIELNHEYWPVFQHFVRLLTDPFIYIRYLEWVPEKKVLSLLSEAISQDRNRLQCEQLQCNLKGNIRNLMSWIKDHVLCTKFLIYVYSPKNCHEVLLDFFMTGGNCTSGINFRHYELSDVLVKFVQKFMDLKSCDEYKVVESIESNYADRIETLFNQNYAKFLVKEEENVGDGCTEYVFEFVNNNVGKKLQLRLTIKTSFFKMLFKIKNL